MTTSPRPRAAAVLVAAGRSTRMNAPSGSSNGVPGPIGAPADRVCHRVRKPFLELEGRTVLEHACAAFDAAERVDAIVIVGHADDLEALADLARSSAALRKVEAIVPGGAERTDSVRAGVSALANLAHAVELVAIHDAARALVTPDLIDRCLKRAAECGAALCALAVRDTLKRSLDGLGASETLDRSTLWAAQTPQAFRVALLRELLERAEADDFKPTDDAALHERYVGPIALVEGDPANLKITTPEDLLVARAILSGRASGSASSKPTRARSGDPP